VVRPIEEEGRVPGIDIIEKIAHALRVSPCWLAYGIEKTYMPGDTLACLDIGARLAAARVRAGLSRNALGKVAGLSHTAVGNIEDGKVLPSVATTEQLAKALGVPLCWLAYGQGSGPDVATSKGTVPMSLPMSPDLFLLRLDQVRTWRRGPDKAPHKPMLLLLMLARIARDEPRLVRYAEIEEPLRQLIIEFGPRLRSRHPTYHPEMPFWRLQGDGIWEVVGGESVQPLDWNADPKAEALREAGVSGGFTPEVDDLLRRDPSLVRAAVRNILNKHFPLPLHEKVLRAVGLEPNPATGET
jgi:transcriptional regulator with XRE-family HTH domain